MEQTLVDFFECLDPPRYNNQTNIKGDCQSDTKAAPQESWNDLTLSPNSQQKQER